MPKNTFSSLTFSTVKLLKLTKLSTDRLQLLKRWYLLPVTRSAPGYEWDEFSWVPSAQLYVYIYIYIYVCLEPVCPLFWWLNPSKQGLFQSKQASFWVPGIYRDYFISHSKDPGT